MITQWGNEKGIVQRGKCDITRLQCLGLFFFLGIFSNPYKDLKIKILITSATIILFMKG